MSLHHLYNEHWRPNKNYNLQGKNKLWVQGVEIKDDAQNTHRMVRQAMLAMKNHLQMK